MASAPPATAPEPVNTFPGEAAPAAPEPVIDMSGLEQDVRDVFAFDSGNENEPPAAPAPASEPGEGVGQAPSPSPVAPEPPAAPATPTPPVAPQPAPPAAPATTPPAATPPPAPATPPADEAALRQASLEAQVAALTATIEQLRASPQGQQPPAAEPPAAPGSEQAGAEQPPRYNLSLPEQVTTALTGEDPAQANQAIHWIVNSLATIVHNNLRLEYRKHFDDRVNSLVAEAGQVQAETNQATSIEQARAQYYEKFADHKNPLIMPIVAAEASKLAAQYPGLTWGDQFMDSLGARVNAAISELRGPAAAAPATPATPARPAAMLPASGPAPAQLPGGSETQEDIMFSTMQEGQFW